MTLVVDLQAARRGPRCKTLKIYKHLSKNHESEKFSSSKSAKCKLLRPWCGEHCGSPGQKTYRKSYKHKWISRVDESCEVMEKLTDGIIWKCYQAGLCMMSEYPSTLEAQQDHVLSKRLRDFALQALQSQVASQMQLRCDVTFCYPQSRNSSLNTSQLER